MSRVWLISVLALCISFSMALAQDNLNSFEYYHPMANAKYISKDNNIAIRQGSLLNLRQDIDEFICITGSISGKHDFSALISDDQKTLVIKPTDSFASGEQVSVELLPGLLTADGGVIGGLAWSFEVSPKTAPLLDDTGWRNLYDLPAEDNTWPQDMHRFIPNDTQEITLPSDFPPITASISDNPDSGYIFLSNFYGSYAQYIMILDNMGEPVYYRRVPNNSFDFKKQPNGLLTYFCYSDRKFRIMDSTYTVIDTLVCGNGYASGTDPHDLQFLDNGHILMIANDPETVDMRDTVSCGLRSATVIGLIIQELDSDKNVIWQWRSWDHISILDATFDINLCASTIDYIHGNAVELDQDGNILLSSRNLSEITKINRSTGNIIWRWGGENNMFTFVNDTRGFSHQHDIRRLPNGNVTMFDNGNYFEPQYSRALEYQLDEVNHVATLVWEYRQTPDVFASVMGNTQRLASGNTIIGWGAGHPSVTELHPDGSKALELTFPGSTITYRAFRFPWHGVAIRPSLIVETSANFIHLLFCKFGDESVVKYYIYADTLPEPTTLIDSTTATYFDLYNLIRETTYHFRVTAVDSLGQQSAFSEEVTAKMPGLQYMLGDANMAIRDWPPAVIGSDVTYLVNYFRGAPSSVPCLINGFYAAADVTGDCHVIGSDVTRLVNFFRGVGELEPCMDYMPAWRPSDEVPADPPTGWPNCDDR